MTTLPPEPPPSRLAAADRDIEALKELLDEQIAEHREHLAFYRDHGVHALTRPIAYHCAYMLQTMPPYSLAGLLAVAINRLERQP